MLFRSGSSSRDALGFFETLSLSKKKIFFSHQHQPRVGDARRVAGEGDGHPGQEGEVGKAAEEGEEEEADRYS